MMRGSHQRLTVPKLHRILCRQWSAEPSRVGQPEGAAQHSLGTSLFAHNDCVPIEIEHVEQYIFYVLLL